MTISITKSRSGHYTVTIRDERRIVVARHRKIGSLHAARLIVADHKARKESEAAA